MRISGETILAMRRCVVGATVLVGGSVGLASVVSAADDDPDATTSTSTEPAVTPTTLEVATTQGEPTTTTVEVVVEDPGVVVPTTVDVTTPGESNPPVALDPDDCPGCGLG